MEGSKVENLAQSHNLYIYSFHEYFLDSFLPYSQSILKTHLPYQSLKPQIPIP